MVKLKSLFSLKPKKKKVFNGIFFVKELTFPAKIYGTSEELSKVIKIINSDKPYPQVYMGFGWDMLHNILGIKGFDASIEEEKEQSSLYEAKDLTTLSIGYKKWTEAKR